MADKKSAHPHDDNVMNFTTIKIWHVIFYMYVHMYLFIKSNKYVAEVSCIEQQQESSTAARKQPLPFRQRWGVGTVQHVLPYVGRVKVPQIFQRAG